MLCALPRLYRFYLLFFACMLFPALPVFADNPASGVSAALSIRQAAPHHIPVKTDTPVYSQDSRHFCSSNDAQSPSRRQGSVRILDWPDVPRKAKNKDGRANVILNLNVPDYKNLLDASASSTPPGIRRPLSDAGRHGIARADAALGGAIHKTASSVLHQLPVTAYHLNRRYQSLPMLALAVTPEALRRLQKHPAVESIYADVPVPLPYLFPEASAPPNNAGAAQSSNLAFPALADTVDIIGARQAWSKGYSGRGWYVAILDTGIRHTHEFFQGKDIVEACFSLDGHCPNGQTSMIGPGAAAHYDSSYSDYDHGTHVSGIAVGRKSDGSRFGVARDADIIAINVFSKFPPEECWDEDSLGPDDPPCVMSWDSDQLAALEYVYSLRGTYSIGAVNLSLGHGEYSEPCDDERRKPAVDNLRNVNIPVVIAAGNDGSCGTINAPACISSAIAIMASSKGDQEAGFNNWHPTLGDIFAPGHRITSSIGRSDNVYGTWSGTSMAAPHVAGGLTLMRQAYPTDSVEALLLRIKEFGSAITTLCPDNKSQKRIFVNNFDVQDKSLPGVMMLLLDE